MSYSNMLTYGNHRRLVWHCLVFSSPWRHWQKKGQNRPLYKDMLHTIEIVVARARSTKSATDAQ